MKKFLFITAFPQALEIMENSEYDQEISQTADNPVAPEEEPLNHHETPGRQIKQSNQLSSLSGKPGNLESHQKSSMHGKVMEFEKKNE